MPSVSTEPTSSLTESEFLKLRAIRFRLFCDWQTWTSMTKEVSLDDTAAGIARNIALKYNQTCEAETFSGDRINTERDSPVFKKLGISEFCAWVLDAPSKETCSSSPRINVEFQRDLHRFWFRNIQNPSANAIDEAWCKREVWGYNNIYSKYNEKPADVWICILPAGNQRRKYIINIFRLLIESQNMIFTDHFNEHRRVIGESNENGIHVFFLDGPDCPLDESSIVSTDLEILRPHINFKRLGSFRELLGILQHEMLRLGEQPFAMTFDKLMRALPNQSLRSNPLENLVKQLNNNALIPVIGAGVSMASGFPGWNETLRIVQGRVPHTDENYLTTRMNEFKTKAEYKKYVHYARKRGMKILPAIERAGLLEEVRGEALIDDLRDIFGKPISELKELNGIHYALGRLFPSTPIMTMNYDHLLELVFQNRVNNQAVHSLIGRNSLSSIKDKQPVIVKIHGSTHSDLELIFGIIGYNKIYADGDAREPQYRDRLTAAFGHSSLLFLGCSLQDGDPTADLIRYAYKTSKTNHFSIVQRTSDSIANGRLSEALEKMGTQPIWYPAGEHQAIQVILAGLLRYKN